MTPPRDRPTFTEAARRQQIIDAALQTIAEQGYTQASFAEIARSLGITKGLIAYHFDGKHDLITSTIQTLLSRQSAYVKARVAAHHDAAGRMQAYIAASFDYIAQHRAHVAALVDLWGSFTSPWRRSPSARPPTSRAGRTCARSCAPGSSRVRSSSATRP